MKQILILCTFFSVFSLDLKAQHVTLLSSDSSKKDSIAKPSIPEITGYNSSRPPYRICLPPPFPMANWQGITKDSLNQHPDSLITPPTINVSGWGPCHGDSDIDFSKLYITLPILQSHYTPKGARKDIQKGKPIILFHGGFGGMPDFSSEDDRAFQRKYGVEFFSQGCMRMPDDDEQGYNQVIFAYLNEKYGFGWQYDLRHDAIGFDKPEKPVTTICGDAKLNSPLAMQLADPQVAYPPSSSPETEASVWWYILPTSGFALLLALYFIKKKKD